MQRVSGSIQIPRRSARARLPPRPRPQRVVHPLVAYLVWDLAAGTTGYKIASFLFRQASTAPAKMSADELRIDTTWAGVTAVEWVSTGDNTWGAASNWSNFYTGSTGSAPGAQGADITFGNNSNVFNVSLDSPRTVGTLRFNSSSSYTISGPGTLTIDTPTSGDLNTSADNTSASYIAARRESRPAHCASRQPHHLGSCADESQHNA